MTLGTPSVKRKIEAGSCGLDLVRSRDLRSPSQRLVDCSGRRASTSFNALRAFSGVILMLDLMIVASVVNLTMDRVSAGVRSLMAVLAACCND